MHGVYGYTGIHPAGRLSGCCGNSRRVPVFVGAMDTSIARAHQRIEQLEPLAVDGLVFTAPYYDPCTANQMINYFKGVAASTKHRILLYDLPGVTQSKITYDMVLTLIHEIPNLAGIKSADLQMFRKLKLNPDVPKDFIMVYSGLDTFDIAYKWGIGNCLDGMLSCTPVNAGAMFRAMQQDDFSAASACLNNIILLRDTFVRCDLWPSYTTAMNLLGYDGNFGPDYVGSISKERSEEIRDCMKKIGEIPEAQQ